MWGCSNTENAYKISKNVHKQSVLWTKTACECVKHEGKNSDKHFRYHNHYLVHAEQGACLNLGVMHVSDEADHKIMPGGLWRPLGGPH